MSNGNTDINANPPVIEGYTDPAAFNTAYLASRMPEVRKAMNTTQGSARTAAMQNLAAQGYLIDPLIDAFVPFETTAWNGTMIRLGYGFTQVPALPANPMLPSPGFLTVPPDLTPHPDPAQNVYAGALYRSQADYLKLGVIVPGDVYLALEAGWALMPGTKVTDADGHTYEAHGQYYSGDPIALMVRVA